MADVRFCLQHCGDDWRGSRRIFSGHDAGDYDRPKERLPEYYRCQLLKVWRKRIYGGKWCDGGAGHRRGSRGVCGGGWRFRFCGGISAGGRVGEYSRRDGCAGLAGGKPWSDGVLYGWGGVRIFCPCQPL